MHRPPRTGDDDAALYDLAPAEHTPTHVKPPSRPQSVAPPPSKTLSYRSAPVGAAPPADTETIKNLHMPLWILAAGVVVNIAAAYFRQRFGTIESALMQVGVQLIGGTIVMLAGVLIAVKFRGIELGKFWPAVLKLAAISVAPSAAAALASPALAVIPFGFLIGWAVEFCLYFALLGVFFDLDESDTWYLVCVIFVLDVAMYFAIHWII